jgi:hypothetical protein
MCIANDFIFDFFPPLHASLDEYLGASRERLVAKIEKLLLVFSEATAETTKGVSSSDDNRVSNASHCVERFSNIAGGF